MPIFEIQGPDGNTYEVDAPDQAKALAGFNSLAPRETPRPSGKHLSFEEGQKLLAQEEVANSTAGQGLAFANSFLDLPIVGPAIVGGVQRATAGLGALTGNGSYDENLKDLQDIDRAARDANPGTALVGNLAGNIAAMDAAGSTALGSRALGMTGPTLKGRALASGLSSAAISGVDAAARGADAETAAKAAALSGGIGGAIPLAGAAINAVLKVAGDKIYPVINALRDPTDEAARRVGSAITRDVSGNPASVMSSADEAVAAQAGIPVVNADRGGEVTRALARSVANQSPEARAVIEKTASDRFGSQSQRAADFIRGLTDTNADDLSLREAVRFNARATNKAAYDAAYNSAEAQSLFTPGLQELMQSPSFRQAVSSVPRRSADRGAVEGFKEIANPFIKNSQGKYVLRQSADGTLVSPNLQFWDQAKRNLDSQIGKAKRAGDNSTAADLMALKDKLVGELDTAVPAFKAARQGAWKAFNAEDAIDAGRQFANQPKMIPEATKALEKLSKTEKDGFATGFASELVDKIKASGDRTNVINSTFKSEASREQMRLVFGPEKAKQIESYVRVEDLVDRLRGAMGNSTTARQLVELGLGAGGGYYTTGDWTGAIGGAALAKGARFVAERADAKAMEEMAKLLTQDNPLAVRSAVSRAAKSPAYMKALESFGNALGAPTRALAIGAGQ